MRVLRSALAILIVVVFTLVLWPVQVMAVRRGSVDPTCIPRWFHRMAARLLGLRIKLVGAPIAEGPCLVVANHVSWLDIVVLGALVEGRFVAKKDMAAWPGIGLLARWQRTVFVDRTNRRQAGQQASEIAAALVAGDKVILFPEGTTSDGNLMLPFNASLFASVREAARQLGELCVQPVAIVYTNIHGIPMGRTLRGKAAWIGDQDLVPHLLACLRTGALDVEVVVGQPATVTADVDRKALSRSMEAEVRSMFVTALYCDLAAPERAVLPQ